jgi:signal transduction histidine kinase
MRVLDSVEGSLTMMQKVLNDVLDLQRMDSGRFESSALPFPFHRTLRSMLGTLKVATEAKNLGLNIELDERIDKCASGGGGDSQGTWVIGDSMRVRQVNCVFYCILCLTINFL